MLDIRNQLAKANTIVVKVGTSTITHSNGTINLHIVEKLVRVLADLHSDGKK